MSSGVNSKILVAYVASPHAGYLKLFRKYEGGILYVLGRDLIGEFTSLVRNLPAVEPEEAAAMVRSLGIFDSVRVLTRELVPFIGQNTLVMPDEDVSHALAEKCFAGATVEFDGTWRLRWDWKTTTHARRPEGERVVSVDLLDRELMGRASLEAQRSPDWWRQIGALLVRNGNMLIVAHNTHMPSEQSAYIMGDPRSNFGPGEHIDASLALHGEAGVIAEAARRGISTAGCDLFVTTFPCPPCANIVAASGIRRLYYADGYSLVAGAETLNAYGIEIVRVDMQTAPVPT
jgi:dCMP deaminase